MRNGFWGLNGVFMGAIAALISSALVLGGFMLAFSENMPEFGAQPTSPPAISQLTPLPPVAVSLTATELPSATASPTPTLTPTPSQTASPSSTSSPSPTGCAFPKGWIPYTVQRGEKLNPLAARFGLKPQELADANCITKSQQVVPGLILYVPGTATAPPIASPVPCAPPSGWVIYIVQPGDTLYKLAQRLNFQVTPYQLQVANCLPTSDIYTGQRLYLPFYPGPIPSPIPGQPRFQPIPIPRIRPSRRIRQFPPRHHQPIRHPPPEISPPAHLPLRYRPHKTDERIGPCERIQV